MADPYTAAYAHYSQVQSDLVYIPPVSTRSVEAKTSSLGVTDVAAESINKQLIVNYATPAVIKGGSGLNTLVRANNPEGFTNNQPGLNFNWALFPAVKKISALPPESGLPRQMQAIQQSAPEQRVSLGGSVSMDLNKNTALVVPWIVVYSNGPMPGILPSGMSPSYVPLGTFGGVQVWCDDTFFGGMERNMIASTVSAVRCVTTKSTWSRGDVFLTYSPFISDQAVGAITRASAVRYGMEFNIEMVRNEFRLAGASLGLATAAAGLGGAPIMYTGYLAAMGSDEVLSDVNGSLRHVIQGANIVETVDEIPLKCSWAITHDWPICIPLNQSWRTVDVHDAIRIAAMNAVQKTQNIPLSAELAAKTSSFMYPVGMRDYMFGMQDVCQGLSYADVGSNILTATTLTDAFILGVIALRQFAYDAWAKTARSRAVAAANQALEDQSIKPRVSFKIAKQRASSAKTKAEKKAARGTSKPGEKKKPKPPKAGTKKAAKAEKAKAKKEAAKQLLPDMQFLPRDLFSSDPAPRFDTGRPVAAGAAAAAPMGTAGIMNVSAYTKENALRQLLGDNNAFLEADPIPRMTTLASREMKKIFRQEKKLPPRDPRPYVRPSQYGTRFQESRGVQENTNDGAAPAAASDAATAARRAAAQKLLDDMVRGKQDARTLWQEEEDAKFREAMERPLPTFDTDNDDDDPRPQPRRGAESLRDERVTDYVEDSRRLKGRGQVGLTKRAAAPLLEGERRERKQQ